MKVKRNRAVDGDEAIGLDPEHAMAVESKERLEVEHP